MPTQRKIRHTGQSSLFETKKKLIRHKKETQSKLMAYKKEMRVNSAQRSSFLIDQKIARTKSFNPTVKKKKNQGTAVGCTIS
jgi:hypothetical protein